MNHFDSPSFNRDYAAEPVRFEVAESPHFTCNFVYRDKDTVFQFRPSVLPVRQDFISKINDLLPSIVGDERAQSCAVEHIVDERLDDGESICLVVPGFSRSTLSSSKQLSTKLLTTLHEVLS